ncbi:hypothetical protein B0O80DRAFT_462622 [Mortierella sp. GBAus27b]|nr:hypothetical protein B0O80DRAFT_462622 [Mortierella sp. GBAus27b]
MVRSPFSLLTVTLLVFSSAATPLYDGDYTITYNYQSWCFIQSQGPSQGPVSLADHPTSPSVWHVLVQNGAPTSGSASISYPSSDNSPAGTNQTVTIQNLETGLYLAPEDRTLPVPDMSIFKSSEPFQWRLYGDEFNHGRYFSINTDTALVIDSLVATGRVKLSLQDQDTPSYLQFWEFTRK